MKAGVTTSVIAHAALVILAIVGLGSAKPLEPEIVESIAVDLVPISDITNIRQGSLDSKNVETETPAVVESDKPAELAQPTGNTEKDQVTPEETATPTPAPVVNTAPQPAATPPPPEPEPVRETPPPEPVAAPEPVPTPPAPKPPEPTPAPPPEPTPAPTPEPAKEVAAVTPTPAPAAPAAPMPALRPAQLQKPVAKPAPKEEPKPVKTAEATPTPAPAKPAVTPTKPATTPSRQDTQAKAADQVADLINSEKSRGAVTGAGGSPTLGKTTGRSATLSQSQLDGLVAQIKACMSVPAGAAEAGITAQLRFSLDGAGNVIGMPQIVNNPGTQLERALASSAQRAVARCGPYTMAVDQEIQATFDPRELM